MPAQRKRNAQCWVRPSATDSHFAGGNRLLVYFHLENPPKLPIYANHLFQNLKDLKNLQQCYLRSNSMVVFGIDISHYQGKSDWEANLIQR